MRGSLINYLYVPSGRVKDQIKRMWKNAYDDNHIHLLPLSDQEMLQSVYLEFISYLIAFILDINRNLIDINEKYVFDHLVFNEMNTFDNYFDNYFTQPDELIDSANDLGDVVLDNFSSFNHPVGDLICIYQSTSDIEYEHEWQELMNGANKSMGDLWYAMNDTHSLYRELERHLHDDFTRRGLYRITLPTVAVEFHRGRASKCIIRFDDK